MVCSRPESGSVRPEFEKVWGESRQSLYVSPGTWLEAVHPDDRERVTRATFGKQANGDYDEEYRVVRPDGSPRWVHERAFPVRGDGGWRFAGTGIAKPCRTRRAPGSEPDERMSLIQSSKAGVLRKAPGLYFSTRATRW